MNILEYIKKYGDEPLNILTEVDALVFNQMAYFNMHKYVMDNEEITIKEAYNRSLNYSIDYYKKKDPILFQSLANSKRYQNIIIKKIINIYNKELEEQFSALSILLPDNNIYIAYKGSTTNITDWKENFNISYMLKTKSQVQALDYLNNLFIPNKVYLGGHSKGGNMAMYAAINTSAKIKEKIINIYNFDGPGFLKINDNFLAIKEKIITYIPGFSIVGRLLYNPSKVVIVKSKAKGFWQHTMYNWQINNHTFINTKPDKTSEKIDLILDDWVNHLKTEERSIFFENIYKIISSPGVDNLKDLKFKDIKKILKYYNDIDEKTKKDILLVLRLLVNSVKLKIWEKDSE